MKNYYVYKTGKGALLLSEQWVPNHVLKIKAKTLSAAKTAFTNYKKMLKENGK